MTAEAILEQALLLPEAERELLCERIWSSLETEPSDADDLTEEQAEELKRRIDHAKLHPEDGVSWEEFKAEVLQTRGLKL